MQDFCTTISDIDLLAARCADPGYWRKVLTKKSYGVPFDGLYFFGGWTRLAIIEIRTRHDRIQAASVSMTANAGVHQV